MNRAKIFVVATMALAAGFTANAQKWGSTPEDSAQCVLNTSLYTESYKTKAYAEAYEPWRQVVNTCPKSSKNLYIRGAKILKFMFNEAAKSKDMEKASAYVDSLMVLYDKQIENFPADAYDIYGRKASDMELIYKNAPQRYYPLYAEAIEKMGEQLPAVYVYKYFAATIAYVNKGLADSTLVVDNYDIASDLLEKELTELLLQDSAQQIKDSARITDLRHYIADVEAAFSPYASCEQLTKIYSKKFEADPTNVNLLKKITKIMRKKGCTNEELFFKATESLYAAEPSPATAYLMGQMCYSKEKYANAVTYLTEAVKGIEPGDDLYHAYLVLGLAQSAQGSYSAARASFYEAAKLNPTKGEPYLQIAQLYAKGSRSIQDNLGGRTAYWAAVDKAVRAKSIDPSPENVEAANRIINSYSSYFPKQADAFMNDILDGQSYYVGGWIGESTTVRTRK